MNPMMTVELNLSAQRNAILECAARCLRSSPCGSFCVRRSSNTCNLAVEKPSPVQLLGDFSDVKCFSKANCPTAAGFSVYGGRCLKVTLSLISYATAQEVCLDDGGHLYHYKSLVFDKEPVRLLLESTGFDWPQYDSLWVGGSDLANEGDFVWSDGTHLASNEPVWRVGEPNNWGGVEHCVTLNINDYVLNDLPCYSSIPFICQIDM